MSPSWTTNDVIKEIISELSLRDRVVLANLSAEDIDVLESIFDMYIGIKTGLADGDREYIMKGLWATVKRTHRLRRAK